ncbi:hypothetical protein ACEXOS_018565 [Herbiconiux sp. P16]|uniref:hypothetical protein n=1 Tax=Herbiconiux wuyangfengii TaxID=3342794 RepID=UPI0035B6DD74
MSASKPALYDAHPPYSAGAIRFGSSGLAAEGYLHVEGAIRFGRRLASEILA